MLSHATSFPCKLDSRSSFSFLLISKREQLEVFIFQSASVRGQTRSLAWPNVAENFTFTCFFNSFGVWWAASCDLKRNRCNQRNEAPRFSRSVVGQDGTTPEVRQKELASATPQTCVISRSVLTCNAEREG